MRSHRNLIAWQRANALVLLVYSRDYRPSGPAAYSLFDQLRRAVLSAQLNIAEGHASGTPANFRRMLSIAYGSAIEAGDLLEVALACGLAPADQTRKALGLVKEVQALVLGLKHSIR